MSDACVRFMRGMISKATLQVADYHTHMVFDDSMSCRVYNGGQMVGFTSLCSVMHRAMQKMLRDMWASMHERGILDGAFDSDRHSVIDVATFYMRLFRVRRENNKKISDGLRRSVEWASLHMLKWIAGAIEAYVLQVYSKDNPLAHLAPPSLMHGDGHKRKYTVVSPEAAWDVMAKAREKRTNLEQAIRLKDDEATLGCSDSRAESWMQKKSLMYQERVHAFKFPQVQHWNLIADPGTHSYKEIMPSVAYSWELNMACLPPYQHLLPGKLVTSNDCVLAEDMVPLAAERKLERVATYRQLQGYSNQIRWASDDKLTLKDFMPPTSCCLDPVQHNEFRYSVEQGSKRVSFIKNKTTGAIRAVLPADVDAINTLILGLDEGSIGTAGVAAAAFKMKATVWAKFDKIHRVIRDMKLAESDCCGKVFAKAKLWSAYLFGLNNRPFGSGSNHTMKQRLLDLFQVSERVESEVFQKYVTRIAKELERSCDSREDQQAIFDELLELKSFTQKLGQPKVSNWFAWNKMAKEQMREFSATKCIFEAVYADVDEPDPDEGGPFDLPTKDPKAQLQAILKGGGGIGLAYKLMKSEMNRYVRILFTVQNGCWDWYTYEIENTKCPKHGFAYNMRLAGRGWQTEKHLWEIIAPLQNPVRLRFMEIPLGESKWASALLALSFHTLSRRAFSLAKHSAPPESLVGVLAHSMEAKTRALKELKAGHRNFLLLERRALESEDAARLRKDMIFLDSPVVRLMFEFHALDKYAPSSGLGQGAVMAYHWTLPDNKIVEDIHQPLRLNARANVNRKLSSRNTQDTILESRVLEQRSVPHPCRVDKSTWVSKFRKISSRYRRTKHNHKSSGHKLPAEWSRIMKPRKDWSTLTEETLQRATAAWVWMNTYIEEHGRSLPQNTRIGDAVLSKLASPCQILEHVGGQIIACLGNRTWAAIGVPLQAITVEGVVHYYSFGSVRVPLMWFHITAPQQWHVVPFVAIRHETHGVVMKVTGPPQPLVKQVLTTKNSNLLTELDFQMIAKSLALAPAPAAATIETLIGQLAEFYGCDASDCVSKFKDTSEETNCLVEDPFAEAIFKDLDADDQLEFREVGDALKKKKITGLKRKIVLRAKRRVRRRRQPAAAPAGVPEAGAAAPAAAAAPVEAGIPRQPHGRGPNVEHADWEPIRCPRCHRTAGDIKYYQNPGNRGTPTWIMRCVTETGAMGERAPHRRSIVANRMSREDVVQWVLSGSFCCSLR